MACTTGYQSSQRFGFVLNCIFSHNPNRIATPSRAGGAAMILLNTVPDESSRKEAAQNAAANVNKIQ